MKINYNIDTRFFSLQLATFEMLVTKNYSNTENISGSTLF